MRPKRNTRWKEPILKQEISSFFSKYASFILSAKAYHHEIDLKNNQTSSQQPETKDTQQNTAPAIIPPQIKKPPQEMTNPPTQAEEVKNTSASTPNLATAQANVQPAQPTQQQQTNGATQETNSAAQGQSQQRPEAAASTAQAPTTTPATTAEPAGTSDGAGNAT
jgi:FtsZ-interacting cell division protein ZipA